MMQMNEMTNAELIPLVVDGVKAEVKRTEIKEILGTITASLHLPKKIECCIDQLNPQDFADFATQANILIYDTIRMAVCLVYWSE